jgi:hypothetical protein
MLRLTVATFVLVLTSSTCTQQQLIFQQEILQYWADRRPVITYVPNRLLSNIPRDTLTETRRWKWHTAMSREFVCHLWWTVAHPRAECHAECVAVVASTLEIVHCWRYLPVRDAARFRGDMDRNHKRSRYSYPCKETVEAHMVMSRINAHIFLTIGLQMALTSALRCGRSLCFRKIPGTYLR